MAWLVFAIAIPFFMIDRWIPFSWMIQHSIELFHGIARTALVVTAWYLFPAHRFVVVPALIVAVYVVTIFVLARRPRTNVTMTSRT